MQILRVFNNNVVLARDSARGDGVDEVVVTGRGIGFQARQGDDIDESKIAKVFVPADGRDPDHSAEMLAGLPADRVAEVSAALETIGAPEPLRAKLTLVTALTDHIVNAAQRAREGIVIEYPLHSEVVALYPVEYQLGTALLREINRLHARKEQLPDHEATALALHFVNAGFATGDLSQTYRMTGLIQQMLEVVAADLGVRLDPTSISVARFITHVRYLFVRLHRNEQLNHLNSPLTEQLLAAYPAEVACARKVASVIELRFDSTLTEDEIVYLGLHIVRLGETAKSPGE